METSKAKKLNNSLNLSRNVDFNIEKGRGLICAHTRKKKKRGISKLEISGQKKTKTVINLEEMKDNPFGLAVTKTFRREKNRFEASRREGLRFVHRLVPRSKAILCC